MTCPVPGRAARHDWAWFLDLDGTLVRLARTPGGVSVDGKLRRIIQTLYRSSGGAVALISGRSIADLDRLFSRTMLPAAGQHGSERRSARGRVALDPLGHARLSGSRRRLAAAMARHPRLLLEDKGLCLALHYRSAPALAGYAHRLARAEVRRLGRGFCLLAGQRVVEIRPAGRDKGRAILEFMREAPFRGRTPVFIGDDTTDEYGFAVVNRLGGCSVKVGSGPTGASFRLRDVAAVRGWLQRGRPVPVPADRSRLVRP